MNKWEYMLLEVPPFKEDLLRDLNIYGSTGWELIATIDHQMVLKKPMNW